MKILKRVAKWAVIAVAVVLAVSFGALLQQESARHADAAPDAIAAAASDDKVEAVDGEFLTLRPRQGAERLGVIFYPGAYTDIRGYASTLRPIAEAGYRVVMVKMPFDLAILATGRAKSAIAANSDLRHWAIIGHSVGGTSAAAFVVDNPGAVDGAVIWDSYPPSFASLADYAKPVWHIHRATPDGKPPETFERQRALFPPRSRWVAIPGGIHMYFGSFVGGGYQEDWAPEISQTEQHQRVVAATLEALADIERSLTPAPSAPPASSPE